MFPLRQRPSGRQQFGVRLGRMFQQIQNPQAVSRGEPHMIRLGYDGPGGQQRVTKDKVRQVRVLEHHRPQEQGFVLGSNPQGHTAVTFHRYSRHADAPSVSRTYSNRTTKPDKLEDMPFPKILAAALFCLPVLAQQPAAITIDNGAGKTVSLTVEDLSKLPPETVKTSDHGTTATFEGALLPDVLAKAGVPVGEKLRGKALAQYLLVEASDGYRAVFALPELDPAFTDRKIYLVWKRDGKALSDKEGPFRIVIPDEKRAARWVRQVVSLKVRQAD
jgi:hypothetical protein